MERKSDFRVHIWNQPKHWVKRSWTRAKSSRTVGNRVTRVQLITLNFILQFLDSVNRNSIHHYSLTLQKIVHMSIRIVSVFGKSRLRRGKCPRCWLESGFSTKRNIYLGKMSWLSWNEKKNITLHSKPQFLVTLHILHIKIRFRGTWQIAFSFLDLMWIIKIQIFRKGI